MYQEMSKQEELERFKAAGERLLRRAQADPKVARQLLRDIGYYKIMDLPDPDYPAMIETELHSTTNPSGE